MEDKELIRFNFFIEKDQLEAVDKYRQDTGKLPTKSEAIRDLINLGLKAYWESKVGGEK